MRVQVLNGKGKRSPEEDEKTKAYGYAQKPFKVAVSAGACNPYY
jgi:hypothetical protein